MLAHLVEWFRTALVGRCKTQQLDRLRLLQQRQGVTQRTSALAGIRPGHQHALAAARRAFGAGAQTDVGHEQQWAGDPQQQTTGQQRAGAIGHLRIALPGEHQVGTARGAQQHRERIADAFGQADRHPGGLRHIGHAGLRALLAPARFVEGELHRNVRGLGQQIGPDREWVHRIDGLHGRAVTAGQRRAEAEQLAGLRTVGEVNDDLAQCVHGQSLVHTAADAAVAMVT